MRENARGKTGKVAGYLIAALAVFFALCLLVSRFGPTSYTVIDARGIKLQPFGYASVTKSTPELQRHGIVAGTQLDLDSLGLIARWRIIGAPQGYLLDYPVVTAQGTNVLHLPATVRFERQGQKWVTLVDTLAILLAGYIGFRRPGLMTTALVLYVGGAINIFAIARSAAFLPDVAFVSFIVPVTALISIFPNLVLASFAIRFPDDASFERKRTAIRFIDALVVIGFLLELLDRLWLPHSPLRGQSYTNWYVAVSAVIVLAATLLSLYYAERTSLGRVWIVFAAIVGAGTLYAFGIGFVASSKSLAWAGGWVFGLAIVIVPIAVAYAILKHRIFDVAFVLNRTLVYAATSTLALVLLGGLEFLVQRYVMTLGHFEGAAIEFGIALVVIIFARLIHQRIDRAVDSLLFRARHEQEAALRRFATTAQFYTAVEPLAREAVDCIERSGRVQGAAIYVTGDVSLRCVASSFSSTANVIDLNDPGYVELRAHREPLDAAGVRTALPGARLYPMVLAGRSIGVIAVGERETGEAMPPDIDDALKAVAIAVGVSLTAIETAEIRQELVGLRARLNPAPA